jgi:hypothetical protein
VHGPAIDFLEILFMSSIREPVMHESLLRRHPLVLIKNQEPPDEIFWTPSNTYPVSIIF